MITPEQQKQVEYNDNSIKNYKRNKAIQRFLNYKQ